MAQSEPAKIAIVDDHPLLIKGLLSLFSHFEEVSVVGTYTNGTDLWKGLEEKQPDVLLLDIQLQGQMGDELAERLHDSYPGIGILVLTNMEHEYYIKAMLDNGVLGYVLKSSEESILIEAIKMVHLGGTYFDPSIRKQVLKIQSANNQQSVLTRREKEILQLIAAEYSSQEIADKLFISKRTVDNHRMNMFIKLDVKNAARLVKKGIDLGLIR